MSKTLLRYVAPFTVDYWIVATSTTDFSNQLQAILSGHTSVDDAVRVAWPADVIQYAGRNCYGGAMYLATSERGITEPAIVSGTAIKADDVVGGVETCYILKGDYAGTVMDFFSNDAVSYKGCLLRSDTNLLASTPKIINFTIIAYNSADEIEGEYSFKCLAGTTWAQFVASGENTEELIVTGNSIEFLGLENYYTVTHTDGGTDNVTPTAEIFATTYYCHYGW